MRNDSRAPGLLTPKPLPVINACELKQHGKLGRAFFHNGFRNLGAQGLFILQGDRLVRIRGGPGLQMPGSTVVALGGRWYNATLILRLKPNLATVGGGRPPSSSPYAFGLSAMKKTSDQCAGQPAVHRLADRLRAVISGRGGLAAVRQHSCWMRVIWGLAVAASLVPAMAFAGDSVPRSDPFPPPHKYPPKTRDIEERRHEVVETGLLYHNQRAPITEPDLWWLNDRLFVVTALQDVPDAGLKKLTRVMRVDAVTGESSTVEAEGSMICWNPDREIAGFKPSNFHINMGDGVRWLGKLDKAGNYQRLSPEPETIDKLCRATDLGLPTGGRSVAVILREADGYIKLSEQGKRFDYDAEAILMRPGHPPKKLGIPAENLAIAFYLPYSKKYFLKNSSTRSNYGRVIQGESELILRPSWLLSPEGGVEVLPYPEVSLEFGLKGLSRLRPTPHGELFVENGFGNHGPQGLFLLQGDRLFRIWGGPGWFARGRNEFINNIAVSPDGCRVAFIRSLDRADTHASRNPISILNLCKAL